MADVRDKVSKFLKQNPVGVLSTVSSENKPWGSAIYFVCDEDFNFYFVTRAGTCKYHNIDKNPSVALTVTDPETQETVQAAGQITLLPVHDYMAVVFEKLARLHPHGHDASNWLPPVSKMHDGNFMPLKLTPATLRYADFGQPVSSNNGEPVFETIM